MSVFQKKMSSPLGAVYLVASETGLQELIFEDPGYEKMKDDRSPQGKILLQAEQEVREYMEGSRQKFEVPLDLIGSDFQKRVWGRLSKIHYGVTKSYKDIAKEIKNEKASRAVGTANGKNPICIIIPCHRVIAANGALGGYSGGLHIKKKLLALEIGQMKLNDILKKTK